MNGIGKSLFVNNLHYDVTEVMLRQKISVAGTVVNVELQKSPHCCAYIYFQHHHEAAIAKNTMNGDELKGLLMQVRWNQKDPAILEAKNANIIIKPLDKSIDQESLYKICSRFGRIVSLKIPSNENGSKGYAYVNYELEEQALEAIRNLKGTKIGRKKVFPEKFIPPSQRRTNQDRQDLEEEEDDTSQNFRIDRRSSSSSRRSFSNERERQRHRSDPAQYFSEKSISEDEDEENFEYLERDYSFVEKTPTIIDSKQKYLQSMLCGKYKRFCNKQINQRFDSKKVKGRLAAVNNEVKLVTTSEASHIECCKVLEAMIFCDEFQIPKSLIGTHITTAALALKIKVKKLKYLALQLEEQRGVLHLASFNKQDIENGKSVVEDFIENFLFSEIFVCDEEDGKLVEKHSSFDLFKVSRIPIGIKIVGERQKVRSALHILTTHRFKTEEISFRAGKLSTFFLSQEWKKKWMQFDDEYKCLISSQQTGYEPRIESGIQDFYRGHVKIPKLQFKVEHGNIVDVSTDVIVNGVSDSFDLNWGKISPAVLAKAGRRLQARCTQAATLHSCLRKTKGYDLSCKHVFHLVTPSTASELTKRVKIVLNEALKMGMKSVSFPTLGAGGIGLEPQQVALAMNQAFQDFANENDIFNSIEKITVVVFDQSLVPVFEQFAIPSEANEDKSFEATKTFSCTEEEWTVKVTGFQVEVVKKVIRGLNLLKSSLLLEETIEDSSISKLEENEFYEFRKLAQDQGVKIKIENSDATAQKLMISGLRENVKLAKRKIQSILNDLLQASIMAKMCIWKREVTPEIFDPFPLRVSRLIATNYEKSPQSRFIVTICGERYVIDLASMRYQCEGKTGLIKREKADSAGTALPAAWAPMNGEPMRRIILTPGSAEYEEVLRKFKASSPRYSAVLKIERIQNRSLYCEYQVKKKDVEAHMKTKEPVERELFHGTAADGANRICIDGFDRGYAGKNATVYGKGSYFAVNSSYSTGYCQANSAGEKSMFLALVLTGNYCRGDSSYVSPPPMGFTDGMRKYDSVVNDVHSPTIFVIFKDSSMYPMYLVTYR